MLGTSTLGSSRPSSPWAITYSLKTPMGDRGLFLYRFTETGQYSKRFLAVHYRETRSELAQACVRRNEYNLTLGSRRGRIIHPFEWSRARVKPGTKVIMSVYVDTEYATRLTCKRSLTVTIMGEFHG